MENTIIIYLIKTSAALLLFWTLYMLLFRKDTFFVARRIYLWLAILFSVAYPFISVEILTQETGAITVPGYWLAQIEVNAENTKETTTHISAINIILTTMAVGAILGMYKICMQTISIINIKRRNPNIKQGKYTIVDVDKESSPFSFFNWIFLHSKATETQSRDKIIIHEKAHARQWHSLDVIAAELLTCLFWWNPIAWLIRREIKINLEYLADHQVLKEGYNPKDYQYLLLSVSGNNTTTLLINNFNVSELKKRITMMNKTKTPLNKMSKYLLALPVCAILVLGNTAQASDNMLAAVSNTTATPDSITPEKDGIIVVGYNNTSKDKKKIYTAVEQMPSYPGGEAAMMKYIATNLNYPESAQNASIEGRVVARFIIGTDGKISDATIVRGIDKACNEEALRVINAMPEWQPGKQKGQAVPVYFTLPIMFKLKADNPSADNKLPTQNLLYIVDGKNFEKLPAEYTNVENVEKVEVYKKDFEKFGEAAKGKKGVIVITSKK